MWTNIVYQLKGACRGKVGHWFKLFWGVITSKPKALAVLGAGLVLALVIVKIAIRAAKPANEKLKED